MGGVYVAVAHCSGVKESIGLPSGPHRLSPIFVLHLLKPIEYDPVGHGPLPPEYDVVLLPPEPDGHETAIPLGTVDEQASLTELAATGSVSLTQLFSSLPTQAPPPCIWVPGKMLIYLPHASPEL